MKATAIGLLCAATVACTDEHNLGNGYSLRAPRWVASLGGGNGQALQVAIDPAGDVVAFGIFDGTFDFGGGTTLTAADPNGGSFLTKRTGVDGSNRWAISVPRSEAMTIGPGGEMIVVGDTSVESYTPDGQLAWTSALVTAYEVTGVAVGADGRIYVSEIVDQPTTGPYAIVAYEPNGTMRWVRQYPATGKLVVATDGSVIMVGAVAQSTTFAGIELDLSKDPDLFVARIGADGAVASVQSFGQLGWPHDNVLVALEAGDQLATTYSIRPPTSGPEPLPSPTQSLLDASGTVLWTSSPAAGDAIVHSVAAGTGAIVTAGQIEGWKVDLGNGPQVGTTYIAEWSSNGAPVASTVYGDPSLPPCVINSIVAGPAGSFAFGGTTGQPIDFGAGVVSGPSDPAKINIVIGVLGS
jgi:hypothetical protein